jgi:hypothetical protein
LLVALPLTACNAVQQPPVLTPAESGTPATEVILFSAKSITPAEGQEPVSGVCDESPVLPRPGAYHCKTEAGADLDPCFFLVEGGNLGCEPNPIALRYAAIVTPSNPLPEIEGEEDPIPFFLSLGAQKPPCAKRLPPPFELDGTPITYSCAAPGAWIVGPLSTDTSAWEANYVVTDTNQTAVTYGPEASFVEQAYVY